MKNQAYSLILCFISFLIFIWLLNGIETKRLMFFDNEFINLFYLHRTPVLTNIMVVFSFLGKEIPITIGTILVIIAFIKKYRKEAITFVLITGLIPIISSILKTIIQRPRPPLYFHPQLTQLDYSFPSGHAMGSLVFYITLSYFIYNFTKNKRLRSISFVISTLLIIFIGISRVYLGVHYPTDVLAGYLAGVFWLSSLLFINSLFFRS